MKVRFAPSPTGLLQVGNARVALINWLLARQHDGTILLRIDDTDQDRSDARFERAIEADLRWLGLDWDETARQSARMDRYTQAAERLKAAGRLYACYETAEELDAKRRLQQAQGRPPVYDRASLHMAEDEKRRLETEEGRRPHWRFMLEPGQVRWHDEVRGEQTFQAGSLSDPVLIREDGRPLYTLTSVVDDIELGATHVIRGEDHVANTAAQIQLFHALEGDVPAFAHLPLLTDVEGRKLSKREGDLSLEGLRDTQHIEPTALVSYLAKLGTPDPIDVVDDVHDLVADFDLSRFGRAAPKFDFQELLRLNARRLHTLSFDAVRDRLAELGVPDAGPTFWDTVRANIERIDDARGWYDVCVGPTTPWIDEADADFLALAADRLPDGPFDDTTWDAWTKALKAETGRKGAKLFKPLRKALTGLGHGPELAGLLPVIGRDRAAARLRGQTA
jgi:glutamyl-tRNA synthetase